MCGISGIFHFDPDRAIDEPVLKRMTDIISHRGPDGSGFYIENNLGLGHRRLSIIDLVTGDQPMYSSDGNVIVVFNGEIYNFIELREELQELGHRFQTTSDTEVIINAYKQWGFDCQNRLNGMWAFAIWDRAEQHLFLSRDRIGEKPLIYALYDNTLLFGSEIKSVLAFGIDPEPDLQLLELYLYLGFVPAPHTFFKDIKKLRAGHYLLIKGGHIEERKYWELPDISEKDLVRDKSHVYNRFRSLFRNSIEIRMRSDVPFGAFLSGGLDSATIVSIMSELSDHAVQTFTIGFKEKAFDERKLAKEVAIKNNTDHHEYLVDPTSFEESLREILFHYDEPFSDPAAIPTGFISKYARQKVKMVLTGDGGDEVLSGYRSYRGEKFAHYYQKNPEFLRKNLLKFSQAISKRFTGNLRYKFNRINQILSFADSPFEERFLAKGVLKEPLTPKNLIVDQTFPIEDYMEDIFRESRFTDPFYKLMFFQFKVGLPDRMLLKVDRISMAHSLETRIPFLDYRLVEEMYLADKSIKLPLFQTKTVLRETFGKNLPKSILNAPKRGFNVPLREWFKDDSFNQKLTDLLETDIGLNNKLVQKMVEENKEGKSDNGNFIYRLIVFSDWIKQLGS